MKRRNALTLAISLATALLAVALLRGCVVSQLRVTSAHCSPTLECGDRILVSRTYYGLRLPGEAVWGYHRWGTRYPKRVNGWCFTTRRTATRPKAAAACVWPAARPCRAIRYGLTP